MAEFSDISELGVVVIEGSLAVELAVCPAAIVEVSILEEVAALTMELIFVEKADVDIPMLVDQPAEAIHLAKVPLAFSDLVLENAIWASLLEDLPTVAMLCLLEVVSFCLVIIVEDLAFVLA